MKNTFNSFLPEFSKPNRIIRFFGGNSWLPSPESRRENTEPEKAKKPEAKKQEEPLKRENAALKAKMALFEEHHKERDSFLKRLGLVFGIGGKPKSMAGPIERVSSDEVVESDSGEEVEEKGKETKMSAEELAMFDDVDDKPDDVDDEKELNLKYKTSREATEAVFYKVYDVVRKIPRDKHNRIKLLAENLKKELTGGLEGKVSREAVNNLWIEFHTALIIKRTVTPELIKEVEKYDKHNLLPVNANKLAIEITDWLDKYDVNQGGKPEDTYSSEIPRYGEKKEKRYARSWNGY